MLNKPLPLRVAVAPPDLGTGRGRGAVFDLRDRLAAPGSVTEARALVVCRWFQTPDPARRAGERLILSVGNGGDAVGSGPRLTCPAAWARDLRDVAAAVFADRLGRVALNAREIGRTPAARSVPIGPPLLQMAFNADLIASRPGRTATARRRDLRTRFATILTLWCRVEGWI